MLERWLKHIIRNYFQNIQFESYFATSTSKYSKTKKHAKIRDWTHNVMQWLLSGMTILLCNFRSCIDTIEYGKLPDYILILSIIIPLLLYLLGAPLVGEDGRPRRQGLWSERTDYVSKWPNTIRSKSHFIMNDVIRICEYLHIMYMGSCPSWKHSFKESIKYEWNHLEWNFKRIFVRVK
jgi:hypothetical protein